MDIRHTFALCIVLASLSTSQPHAVAQTVTPEVAVASQYDSTHVYIAPNDIDAFVKSFLGTFGGTSTPQVVATVTPTPSSTTSQLLKTPVGMVSLFGFKTPIPYPFGAERTGYLVKDLSTAVQQAQAAGAAVLVSPFQDPIGMDAIIQWPGGIDMQLYWHTKSPSYPPLQHIPENRIYLSPDNIDAFIRGFLTFSHGRTVSDDAHSPGTEVGTPNETVRRIQIESTFGKMSILVSKGFLPFPYGRETTGYEVDDLGKTLAHATSLGVKILVPDHTVDHRRSSMVEFPGGYIAEIHELAR